MNNDKKKEKKEQQKLILTVSDNKELHRMSMELINNRDTNIHFNKNDYVFDCIRFYEEWKDKIDNKQDSKELELKKQLKQEILKELDDKLNYFMKGFNSNQVVPTQVIQPIQEKVIDIIEPKKKNRLQAD